MITGGSRLNITRGSQQIGNRQTRMMPSGKIATMAAIIITHHLNYMSLE